MARHQASRPSNGLYADVTDRFILELEAGRFPWVEPWDGWAGVELPRNAVTGRRYSGVNILLLWEALADNNYVSQRWMTYRQAQAMGAVVRKGEQGTTVVYADRWTPQRAGVVELPLGDGGERRQVAFLKRFTVFNVEQLAGLPIGCRDEEFGLLDDRRPGADAEALVAATGADVRVGGGNAFYLAADDYVGMPSRGAYPDRADWYRTVFYELACWTGHPSRLDRYEPGIDREDCGREELTAELCSAFVCAELGIVPGVRHPERIGAWLDILRGDPRAIFRAASRASKAADYLLACRVAGVDAAADERREAA